MGVFGYFGMWELEQNTMGMKVNHDIPRRKDESILMRVGFDFNINDFFILISIIKYNPNTLMNENGIDFRFPFSIPTFQM